MTSKSNFAKNGICLLLLGTLNLAAGETPADRTLPVRGFCIASPSVNRMDEFVKFIEEELAPRSVNVLILSKSYCPRHPKIHEVVFALVDEVCEAFEADAFHAGMDEVFYIGEDQCPRCKGRNKAELFADEVRAIHDHLQSSKRQLWLWGDRLLDGKLTGSGEWEASRNDTHPAVDLIPKDVVICDWHYARADPTAVYFAMKGLDVVSCSWKNPEAATAQVKDMVRFRGSSMPPMKQHFQGVVQTIWSGSGGFFDQYYGRKQATDQKNPGHTESKCFLRMFEEISNLK